MRYDPAAAAPVEVTHDSKGNLQLPAVPAVADTAGQCRWVTAVFALDPEHGITGGRRYGLTGPRGTPS